VAEAARFRKLRPVARGVLIALMVIVAGALIVGIAVATRGEIDIWEVFDLGWLRKPAQDHREEPEPTSSKDRE